MNIAIYSSSTAEWGTQRLRCAIGWGGISHKKEEGDGVTPAGNFNLRQVFYRADRVREPRTILPVSNIGQMDGWSDYPQDPHYNHHITLPSVTKHEKLWREDNIYDIIAVIGYNDNPVVSGAGSAIFMHLANIDYTSTQGCVAFSKADLLQILEGWTENSLVNIGSP